MSTVQFTGKSEEDAVRKAAKDLSIPANQVNYKIVSRTSGGLLGMLGAQVVTIEVALRDKTVSDNKPAPEKKSGSEGQRKAAKSRPTPRPKTTTAAEPKPTDDDEAEPEDTVAADDAADEAAPAPARQARKPRRKKPRREESRERDEEPVVVDEAIMAEKVARAQGFIDEIVGLVGGDAEVKAFPKEAEIHVTIVGDIPDWMGRGSSRTVESLQFLANKVVNRFAPRYRVMLITEGRREQRLEQLEVASLELARKVKENGESIWLVPMNPKERRIVHMAVATVDGLSTRSVGDATSRRLCIARDE